MESTQQAYMLVRDSDLAALEQMVNEHLEEGFELAGQLVFIPGNGGNPPMFVQPLILADEDDELFEEIEDDDAQDDEDE